MLLPPAGCGGCLVSRCWTFDEAVYRPIVANLGHRAAACLPPTAPTLDGDNDDNIPARLDGVSGVKAGNVGMELITPPNNRRHMFTPSFVSLTLIR